MLMLNATLDTNTTNKMRLVVSSNGPEHSQLLSPLTYNKTALSRVYTATAKKKQHHYLNKTKKPGRSKPRTCIHIESYSRLRASM